MKKKSFVYTLIAILTPILIITSGMRVALSPLFYHLEYRLPNFPPDEYGFTLTDRLRWADFSIDFIAGRIDSDTFSGARLPDGSRLFNEREIAHMVDVRDLTVIMLWVWRFLLILFIDAYFVSRKDQDRNIYFRAIATGGKATITIIAGVLLFLVINFNQLFTAFHRIFFEGDTWLFFYTDSLIRLFPLKFWQDLFIFIGLLSLVFSVAVILIYRKKRKIPNLNS